MVQAGLQYTCGVQQNGSLWCWGDNAHGGLGNGTQDNSLVPVEVVGMGWVSVAAGAWHTCGIKADQTLWCWGGNSAGEVGNGGTDDSLTPVQIGGTDWQSVSVGVATGSFHTCGVKLDGSLWCWGENSAGQLGTGSTAGSVTPVQVGSATWTNMSGGNLHTCGVESDGTLWCWGDNEQGQIGDGTLTNRLAPARVPGQAWAQVAAGNVHTCGRRQDGSLWCWGWNGEGEIGDGTTDTHQAPTQVAGSLCGQVPICGNGVKEPGEQCDDGNNVPGDGCTMDCQVEKCFNPNCPEPDACHDKGVCDPATGNCSNPSKEDGASCGQGNAGICQQGVCLGGGAHSSVNPVFNCLAIDATGVTFAVFGYVNGTGGNIHVPLGAENVMTPASVAVPPTWFAPGEHRGVLVAALSGGNVSWQIGSSVAEAHQDSTPICPVVLTPQGDAADLGGGDRAPLRPLDPGDLATLSVVDTEVDSKGMAAGPLSGRFAVNADGAATYVLPLNVPEGRAGMGPKLALQYNSQGGNGMIGVGWSLAGGFSQIARCRKIHAVDGEARAVQFDDSDRFCLDGEYLVASPDKTLPGSGVTEYRTERDPFVRISVSQKDALGPTSFLVEYGDGRKLTYDTLMEGNRATVVANHAKFDPTWATYATVRYAWLLSKVVDSVGNTMTIDYTGDGEEMLPKTFSYTSFVTPFGWRLLPALRQVVLTYVDRPDPSDSWVSGYQLKSSRLLKIIEVRGPAPNSIGTLFKYLLDYKNHSVTGNSLLSSVTECDAKGVCKPAATFDWEVGSSAFRSGAGLYLPEKENLGGSLKFADIDGDGLPDLLYMTGTTLKYGHASEGINIVTGTLEVVFDASYNDETGITTGSTPPSLDDVTPMDIDGDGKAELVVRQVEKGMSWLRYYKYDGTNFNLIPDDGNEIPDVGPYVYVADLDGDGLPELIRAVNYASPQYPDWRWAYRKIVGGVLGPYSQLGGSAALSQYNNYVGDLDGSGRTSILFRGGDTNDTRYLWASLSNNNVESGASTVPWVARSGNDGMGKVLLDLNADGVADAVEYPVTDSLSESSAYFVNTGNGMLGGTANFATPIAVGQMISAGAGGNDRFIVMDVNQDGRDDIVSAPAGVSPDAGPLRAFLSNGKGLSSPTTISEAGEVINWGGAGDGKLFRAIDLNGDGLTDFVMQNGEYLEVHMHDGKKADMITAFHSATGASTSVTYSPWKETSSLSPGCNYPVRCPKRGLWVVSEHKVDPGAGNGSPALFDYGYSSAHIDVLGRGWLGFTEQSTTDKQTNGNRLVRTENYSRWGTSYPFVGRPSRVTDTVTLDDGRILTSKSEMSYGVIAGNILQAGQTYAIGLQSVLYHESETASGSGVETTVRQISESMQYDSYGNVSYRERDGSSTFDSTQSSYLNDTANWILSPPTSRTWVSKSSGESMSRAKSWTYDGGPARLLKTATVQPGGDASQRLDITYTRNPLGLPVTITAVDLTGEQRMTTIQYDAIESSRPVVVTDPAGFVTRTAFHTGLNLPVWQLDQNGLTTTWTYDGFGRIRVASPPSRDDVSTSYKVPSTGGVFEIDRSRVSGGRSSVVYDSLGRAVRGSWATANGKTSVVTASYDARFPGKLARLSIPRFDDDPAPDRFTVATYDFAGRIKTVTDPDATFSRFEYEGLETTTYDRKGNKSYVAADELGRVVKSKQWTAASDPGGAREIPVTYQIGPFGVIRRIQDAKGNNIWSTYDDLGRKTNMTDPDAGWRKYTYSAFGDLLSEEDPKGKTTLSHDADGRPTGAVSPDGTTKLVWDSAANGLGALAATTSADRVIRTMAYDTLSRPTSATWEIEDEFYTGEQTYDGFGRLYTVTYPDTPGWTRFKTEYQYAGNGDLLSLTDVPSAGAQARLFWKADDRDAAGRLKLEEFGNKVTTTQYGIDEDRGVVTGITTKSGDVTVQSLGFAYDANLNLSDRTDSLTGVLEHFDYDALDRLQTWQEIGSLGWKVTYSHDDIGNLTGRSLLGSKGETEDLTFEHSGVNAGPHAVTGSAWGSYEYDTKGNQTKSPEGIIDYTVFNLPKQITGSVTTSYKYDASGTRVLKRSSGNTGTTVYVGALYERRGDAGSRSHVLYLNAAGRRIGQVLRKEADNSEQVQYIHGDVLGSSETVTDDSGKLVGQARKYDPFGGPTDLNLPKAFPGGALMSGDVHLGFTGHEEDSETGLINMRGRIYNPRVGHFLTPDPFLPNPMSSIGLGRYSYALNNPLTYTDPTGFEPVDYGGQLYSEGDKLPSKNGAVFEYDDEQVHSDLVMVFGDHQVVADRRTRISFDDEQVVADTRTGGIGFSPYDSSTWTPGQNGVEMCGAGGFCGMQRRWPGGGVQRDNDTWVDVPLKGGFVQTLPMGVYQDQYEYRPDNSNKLTVDFNRAQVADGPNNTVTVNGPSRSTPVQGMSAATSRGGGNGVGPSAAARDAWAEVAKLHALAAQIPNGILMPRAEPRGVSMAANIELGRQHFGDLIWFAQQVHTGGPMDYKQMGRQYEEFGNMNYGAVGRALGVPEQVLLRAAGAVQIQSGTSDPAFGGPLDTHGPFGDDPVDQFWVHQGARLYEMRASEP
jgi:RHS repeat-associated protein